MSASKTRLSHLDDQSWVEHFSDLPIEGSFLRPLCLKYHGHQFRHYNPNLGDGRGFFLLSFQTVKGLWILVQRGPARLSIRDQVMAD